MVVPLATDHLGEMLDDLECTEESTILPSSALLHEHGQAGWSIGQGFGIWHVADFVASLLLDVNLKAHDTVFGQVFVSLGARWKFLTRRVSEEHIKW